MKLILDYNKEERGHVLLDLLNNIPYDQVTEIKASVAYNRITKSFRIILKNAKEKNIKVSWWGLLDERGATEIKFLEEALKSENTLTFYYIGELYHSKLIHFIGYGVYIGSANMTNYALEKNLETGIFFTEEELKENYPGKLEEIKDYFIFLEDKHEDELTENIFIEYEKKIKEYRLKDKKNRKIRKKRKKEIKELLERFETPPPPPDDTRLKTPEEIMKYWKEKGVIFPVISDEIKKNIYKKYTFKDILWLKCTGCKDENDNHLHYHDYLYPHKEDNYPEMRYIIRPDGTAFFSLELNRGYDTLNKVKPGQLIMISQKLQNDENDTRPLRCFSHLVTPISISEKVIPNPYNQESRHNPWHGRWVEVIAVTKVTGNGRITVDSTNWKNRKWIKKTRKNGEKTDSGYKNFILTGSQIRDFKQDLENTAELEKLQEDIFNKFIEKGCFLKEEYYK